MKKYKYLIIGGGIAGTTAAETLRKEQPEASVAIISAEPHPLYSRILLSKPNFFLEKVPFDTIWMRKPEWYTQQGIDYLSGQEATMLDATNHLVTLANGTQIEYEKLLLAIGCPVRRVSIPGLDKRGCNYVKTVEDAREIITNVKRARRAIVVGSGFISFEMLDMLHLAGLEVEAVIREKYFWEPLLDEPAGRIIERRLAETGIKVHLESEVSEVLGDDSVTGVVLKNGEQVESQIVILGVGTQLTGEWLKLAGLEIRRGIVATERLETNLADIWTAGDVAEFKDVILDSFNMCGLWINAQLQGQIAALNMLGRSEVYRRLSSYIAHGFGLNIGFVGQVWRDKDCEIISRGDPLTNHYTGIVIRGGQRIIGGFMMNTTQDMAPITRLIEAGVDILNFRNQLADSTIDLSSLFSE
ncbi:FAD-dependent oxidoreductase [Patescibacteria group bacterium]|nr:FAD-dependent oxidoreductase [Patescibacteria group bacterium]MBU1028790.1 FAD-dependent oxidoreductase [Patescibacteria group bacterium]